MNMWKLSILALCTTASVALGVGAAGCTVTSTSSTDDGGTDQGDASTSSDSATQSDGATQTDGGSAEASTCAATTACPVIQPPSGANFDNCGACDTCVATKCCTEATSCFAPDSDGGESDCTQLFDCYAACDQTDGGQTCVDACATAHAGSKPTEDALNTCASTNCKTECGI